MNFKDIDSTRDLKAMHRAVHDEKSRRTLQPLKDRISELENRPVPGAQPPAEEPADSTTTGDSEEQYRTIPRTDFGDSPFEGSNEDRTKAKQKVQAFKGQSSDTGSGANIDYSFNAGGGGTSNPPQSANEPVSNDYGASAGSGYSYGDEYGNVTPERMKAEHHAEHVKNSHLNKIKSGLVSSGK